MIVNEILQEEFDSREAAIAKYGKHVLIVKQPDGHQYQLQLKRHYRHDWDAVKPGDKEVSIKEFYKYVEI